MGNIQKSLVHRKMMTCETSTMKNPCYRKVFVWLLILISVRNSSLASTGTGLPSGLDGKEFAHNAGDTGSILGQKDPLQKGMATYSSILGWRIPWAEEPGRLQSMGLQSWT